MNNEELSLKLKAMKNELTALKTAHERGLGAFQFYTATTTYRATSGGTQLVEVTATVADGEPIPPVIELAFSTPYYCMIESSVVSSNNKSITWKIYYNPYYIPAGTTLRFKVVSISKIASLTAKEGQWDV